MKRMIVIMSLILFIFSFILSCSNSNPSPVAKEAYLALKKIEARVETGVNIMDYSKLIGDANFEIKKYTESQEAIKNKEITLLITRSFLCYLYAAQLWRADIGRHYGDLDKTKNEVKELFPDLKDTGQYDLKQDLWQEATKNLKELSRFFN